MSLLATILAAIIMNNASLQNEGNFLLTASVMETENQWRIVNDGVMGGLSSSKVMVNGDNKIVFRGKVSLENNGGFASLRSPVKNYNFEKFSGIELRIKGDGKRYSISMKETSYFTRYFYKISFETNRDEWVIVQIPFNKFKQYYYGRKTNSDKSIPLNKIKEISLLIGDKQEGNFIIEVDYINLN